VAGKKKKIKRKLKKSRTKNKSTKSRSKKKVTKKESKKQVKHKVQIPFPNTPTYQIQNLLDLLNNSDTSDEISQIIKFPNKKTALKVSNEIINHKYEFGNYYKLEDVLSVASVNGNILQLMLDASRYSVVGRWTRSHLFAASFKWSEPAVGWDQIGEFHILYQTKQDYMDKRLDAAEKWARRRWAHYLRILRDYPNDTKWHEEELAKAREADREVAAIEYLEASNIS